MLGQFLNAISRLRHPRSPGKTDKGAIQATFSQIYEQNYWGAPASRSGTGSDLLQTAEVRRQLPSVVRELEARSILDIPCGDFHWMKEVELEVDYTGGDIVEALVRENQQRYGNPRRRFLAFDLTSDDLPKVDLIFCRDALVHLSNADILASFANVRRSGSRYILTTTFIGRETNFDIETGLWRPLNLQKPPFNLPDPIALIDEKCTEGDGSWGDKCLGLWQVSDLKA